MVVAIREEIAETVAAEATIEPLACLLGKIWCHEGCRKGRAMYHRRIISMSLAMVAGSISSFAQDNRIMPHEQTIHRAVQAGAELRVFTYATWTAGCDPEPPPTIKILTQPAHGKAELRPGPATVRFVRQGAPDCTGKVIPGLGVWYIPAPGFHGADKFDANITPGENGTSHDIYIIDVK
jgi:hypothetical protein